MPAQGGEYNSYRWQQQRARVLKARGEWCQFCGKPARSVDHQIPLRLWRARRGDEPYPDELCVVLCAACHGRKDGGRSYS